VVEIVWIYNYLFNQCNQCLSPLELRAQILVKARCPCNICNYQKLGDEYHYVLECSSLTKKTQTNSSKILYEKTWCILRKPPTLMQVSDDLFHIMMYQYISPWAGFELTFIISTEEKNLFAWLELNASYRTKNV
jgi:hypothetical protein